MKKCLQFLLSLVVCFHAVFASAQEMIPMNGKTVLITGSTSGLGKEVALQLGALGATVIVHGRDAERGEEVVAEINQAGPGKAMFYQADLASLAEVKALSERVKAEHSTLHMLINNAGILGSNTSQRRESADGYELLFAVNYLSHFMLTRELLPLLEQGAPARIINVASIGQRPLDFDDLMLQEDFNPMGAYSQSKLAQIMFTITLAEQLDASQVTVNSLHPATMMDTSMVRDSGMRAMTTVDEGVETVMHVALSSDLTGRSGLYFNQLEETRANDQAYDKAERDELWDVSLDLISDY